MTDEAAALRIALAGLAMHALIISVKDTVTPEILATVSRACADALLAELAKPK